MPWPGFVWEDISQRRVDDDHQVEVYLAASRSLLHSATSNFPSPNWRLHSGMDKLATVPLSADGGAASLNDERSKDMENIANNKIFQ